MTPSNQDTDLLVLTSNIVTAHVGRNNVPTETLPQLINDVFKTLRNLKEAAGGAAKSAAPSGLAPGFTPIDPPPPKTETPPAAKPFPGLRAPNDPAIDPARSIQPDFLVCIESGEKFKTLKRHLAAEYKMTPEQYREKWNLPRDYPMVAPNYSAVRSHLAKESRLGGSAPRTLTPPVKMPETVSAETAAGPRQAAPRQAGPRQAAPKKAAAAKPPAAKKKPASRS